MEWLCWGATIKSWFTTQAFIIAVSSGEAEYYGVVKGSAVAIGLKSLFTDLGTKVQVHIHTDATAAKGIASCKGLSSRTRHVGVHFLCSKNALLPGT